MPSTFQGHFGPKPFCASHHAWWSLLARFDVYHELHEYHELHRDVLGS